MVAQSFGPGLPSHGAAVAAGRGRHWPAGRRRGAGAFGHTEYRATYYTFRSHIHQRLASLCPAEWPVAAGRGAGFSRARLVRTDMGSLALRRKPLARPAIQRGCCARPAARSLATAAVLRREGEEMKHEREIHDHEPHHTKRRLLFRTFTRVHIPAAGSSSLRWTPPDAPTSRHCNALPLPGSSFQNASARKRRFCRRSSASPW